MQAQRKFVANTPPRPATPEEAEGWAPGTEGMVEAHSSPAHLMLRDLAARLHEPGQAATPVAASVVLKADDKLSMPARLAVIGGLAIACWGLVLVAAISIM